MRFFNRRPTDPVEFDPVELARKLAIKVRAKEDKLYWTRMMAYVDEELKRHGAEQHAIAPIRIAQYQQKLALLDAALAEFGDQ